MIPDEPPPFARNRTITIAAIALGTATLVLPGIASIPTVGVPGDGSHDPLEMFRIDPALAIVVTIFGGFVGAALAMIALARPFQAPAVLVPGFVITTITAILAFVGGLGLGANPLLGLLFGAVFGCVLGCMYILFTFVPLGAAAIGEARPTFASADATSLATGLWLAAFDGWLELNVDRMGLRTYCNERCLDAHGGHAPPDVTPFLFHALAITGIALGIYLVVRSVRGIARREGFLRRLRRGELADLRVRALQPEDASTIEDTLPLRLVDALNTNSIIERVTLAPIAAGYRSAPTEIVEPIALVYTRESRALSARSRTALAMSQASGPVARMNPPA